MKIARVFPRKTKASPIDDLSFFDSPGMFPPYVDEVHISVTFSWDMPKAEWLALQWSHVAPVKIGGPALNEPAGDFVPGRYLKDGYVITSRGCPNKCWFCRVWKAEGGIRELEIKKGCNILDDNLLACSRSHIIKVFGMLSEQKKLRQKIEFTGGLEAKRLDDWIVNLLSFLKPSQMFFAYDTPDDLEPLKISSEKLHEAGFNRQQMRCYVLIGFPDDTLSEAHDRLITTTKLGFMPMAMLWRNQKGDINPDWLKIRRHWSRPAIMSKYFKEA
jgi:hypothetical protein